MNVPVGGKNSLMCVLHVLKYRNTFFYCTLLYCVSQKFHFLQTEGFGNPVSSESNSAILSTAFAHFMSVSHFSNSHNI